MRAAAALLALVLAAASTAARDTDVLGVVGAVTIEKISYKDQDKETEICFKDTVSVPNRKKIELVVTSGGEMYSYATESATDNEVKCVSFQQTVKPQNGEVEYLVAFMDGTPAQQADAVKFQFTELPTEDTFSCGEGNDFKRIPEGSDGCDTANPPDSGYCYEAVPSLRAPRVLEKGCTEPGDVKPTHDGFQYCQPVTGQELGDGGETTVETLSYIEKALVLGSSYKAGDVVVVLSSKDAAQFIRITEQTSTIVIDQTAGKFPSSTSTYTTCVVVKDAGGAGGAVDTVTKPASITDLDVKGDLVNDYYEFGFMQAASKTKYHAVTGHKKIMVNCGELTDERCFGYLQKDANTLTVSFDDDSNTIEVNEATLEWPWGQ